MLGVVAHRHRHGGLGGLVARHQPVAHELDLVGLAGIDPPGDRDDILVVGPPLDQPGHLDRLSMVDHHVLHEANIARSVAGVGELQRLFRPDHPALLARRARQHDLCFLRESLRRERDGGCAEQQRSAQGAGEGRCHGYLRKTPILLATIVAIRVAGSSQIAARRRRWSS